MRSGGDPVGIEGLRQSRAREREEPSQVLGLNDDDKVHHQCFAFSWLGCYVVPDSIRHSVSFIVLRPVEAQCVLAHAHTTPEQLHLGAKGMVYHREGMHSGIESGIQYIQAGN